ncbi:Ribonuclease P protein subunit p40, partial [Eschrichtius robustus]|nr:Ribonuclease P protein subunit p40 [Eschrichtius robustus]
MPSALSSQSAPFRQLLQKFAEASLLACTTSERFSLLLRENVTLTGAFFANVVVEASPQLLPPQSGACYALTYNTNIDEDNTVALLPNVVSIDLMDLSSKLDSKKYERISWAFKEKKPLKFDFLLAWHQTGAEGSAMMSYFSSYRIQEHQPKIVLSTMTDVQCPVLQSGELRGQPGAACSAQELFEWLGAVFSNAALNNEPDNFISTYCCPQPSTVVAKAYLCTITGFILPEKIRLLLEQLCVLGAALMIPDSGVLSQRVPLFPCLGSRAVTLSSYVM